MQSEIVLNDIPAKVSGALPYRVEHVLLPRLLTRPAHAADRRAGARTQPYLGVTI